MSVPSPQFEIAKVFRFDATDIANGTVTHLADNGTFAGYDLVNGRTEPAIWDASGARTLMDTTGITFIGTCQRGVFVRDATCVAANLMEGPGGHWIGYRWDDGSRDRVSGWSVVFNDMNRNGVVSGLQDGKPGYWQPGVSAAGGTDADAAVCINSVGDVGYLTKAVIQRETNTRTRRQVTVWKQYGPSEVLAYPADLDAEIDGNTWSNETLIRLYDDGSALVHAQIPYNEGRYNRTVRCTTSGGSHIEGLTGRGVQMLMANRNGLMYGYSYNDAAPFHLRGQSRHTIWIDGVATEFPKQVTNAADYADYVVTALSDAGQIAGVARDKSTGAWHGVLFNRK